MTKLRGIAAVLAFFGVLALGTGLIAQQGTGGEVDQRKGMDPMNPTVKALIEARMEVAKGVFEATMQRKKETLVKGAFDEMPAWSRRWMDEQIHLDPSPIKSLAAIQAHLDRIKRIEEMVGNEAKVGQGNAEDGLKMKYFRLEAEQMLAELRIINPGLFPAKPTAKP